MNYKEALFFIARGLTIFTHKENKKWVEKLLKNKTICWDKVVIQSTYNYVLPALYNNLKKSALLHFLPKDLVEYMSYITNLNLLRNKQIIKQAKEKSTLFSVFIVDVDDFKKVNDQYGHQVGDKTLKEIARLGGMQMRDGDTFGRLGGEEFVALLPNTNKKQALEIAERLRLSVVEYVWPSDQTQNISISIGVAQYCLEKHQTFETLLKDADTLMYQAKHQGKNKVCVNE